MQSLCHFYQLISLTFLYCLVTCAVPYRIPILYVTILAILSVKPSIIGHVVAISFLTGLHLLLWTSTEQILFGCWTTFAIVLVEVLYIR